MLFELQDIVLLIIDDYFQPLPTNVRCESFGISTVSSTGIIFSNAIIALSISSERPVKRTISFLISSSSCCCVLLLFLVHPFVLFDYFH